MPKAQKMKMVSVRFDQKVMRKTMHELSSELTGEGMWIQPVWMQDGIGLGKLRNQPVVFPFSYNDWVVFAEFEEYKGVALACVPAKVSKKGILGVTVESMPTFLAIAKDHLAELKKELACAKCGCEHAMHEDTWRGVWMVHSHIWAKVPKKYREKILCKACFQKLTGLNPSAPENDRFAHEK